MNILFVEHDVSHRRMAKDMLREAGATLVERAQGTDAAVEGIPAIGLAIVDVAGEGEGLTVIKRLRSAGFGSPPIVAVVPAAGLVEASRAAGADEVLVEPVALTTLFDAIGRFLPLA